MTTPKASHTPGLLKVEIDCDYGTQAEREVCRIEGVGHALTACVDHPEGFHASPAVMRANAARLVSCWNALEGIAEPEAVRELIVACIQLRANDGSHGRFSSSVFAASGIRVDAALARLEKGGE